MDNLNTIVSNKNTTLIVLGVCAFKRIKLRMDVCGKMSQMISHVIYLFYRLKKQVTK